jgi:CDP-4-dehydro-6-deoxyglucose reductase, E1
MIWKLQENVVTDSDLDVLVNFIRHARRYTQFEKVREYENAFARWQGCNRCIYVNSGSSANLLLVNAAKELFGWKDGDEVIVPAVTWPTTITPVMHCALKPVFADVNLTDLALDYGQLENKITNRTRAVFVVHLLGFPADMIRIEEIVRGREITILEDCCESMGATLNGAKIGNFGGAGTFSFYWGHHMTTVEGGMICTDSEDLYKLLVLKRSHGLARELPEEYHEAIKVKYPEIDFNFLFLTDGVNFRNTELNAVLGLSQLEAIDRYIQVRNRNYFKFYEICKRYPKHLVVIEPQGVSSFVLPFLFYDVDEKKEFEKLIRGSGVETRPIVGGNLLRQPFLSGYYNAGHYPNADFVHTNGFYIGNNQFVDEERMVFLDDLIRQFFGQ